MGFGFRLRLMRKEDGKVEGGSAGLVLGKVGFGQWRGSVLIGGDG